MNKLTQLAAALLLISSLYGCGKSSTSAAGEVALNVGGGAYKGTFTNNVGTDDGDITLDLTQNMEQIVTGVVTFTDSLCLESGSASGEVIGSNLVLTISQREGFIALNLTASASSLTGSYSFQGEGDDVCSSESGSGAVEAIR